MSGEWDWAKEVRVSQGPSSVVSEHQKEVLSGLTPTTAWDRATKAIDEEARRHSQLGDTVSEVREGADEVFWRDYGTRAIYHHWQDGTHVLIGLILEAYRAIGGAESSGLGPPLTSEVWDDPIVETRPDGSTVAVTPKSVLFREGKISYSQDWDPPIRVLRTPNSKCALRWSFDVIQQRSGNDWHDEDWLCAVWTVNGVPYPMTVALKDLNGERPIHGRPENPAGRTPIAPVEDYVICNRYDLVTVHYTVVNLSGVSYDKQVEQANRLTGEFLEWFAPKYADVAAAVLAAFIPPLAPVFLGIASALPGYREGIAGAAGLAWDEVGAPAVRWLVDAMDSLMIEFGKRANCSGLVMHDYVVFEPMVGVEQTIDKTYTADRATHCQTPETLVQLTMTRTV